VRYSEEEEGGKGGQVPIGNGGVAASHTWTQTLYETTVTVDAPAGTRAKDVKCNLGTTSVSLELPGGDVVEGEFYDRVDASGSMWTLDRPAADRTSVVLTLEKTQETWWRSVFKDAPKRDLVDCTLVDSCAERVTLRVAPKVDFTQVDSTKKMDEYDEKTQAGIRKIMFDQRQTVRESSSDLGSGQLYYLFIHAASTSYENASFLRGARARLFYLHTGARSGKASPPRSSSR